MRCRKCGTISFDHHKQCAKCGQDLSSIMAMIGEFYAPPSGFSWFEETGSTENMEDSPSTAGPETVELKAVDISELSEQSSEKMEIEPDIEIDTETLNKLAEDEIFKEALEKVA